MTCIVGLSDGKDVWIGGDSAGVAGYDITVRADEKVFRNGEFLMGFTSSFRMGQLLRFNLNIPARFPGVEVYEYMVTTFINAVRDCLKEGGYARKVKDSEEGGTFLVGYEGRLFFIDSDYQVGIPADGYAAVGCGDMIALGSMYALAETVKPRQRIKLALEAAAHFSAGVSGPFVIEKL